MVGFSAYPTGYGPEEEAVLGIAIYIDGASIDLVAAFCFPDDPAFPVQLLDCAPTWRGEVGCDETQVSISNDQQLLRHGLASGEIAMLSLRLEAMGLEWTIAIEPEDDDRWYVSIIPDDGCIRTCRDILRIYRQYLCKVPFPGGMQIRLGAEGELPSDEYGSIQRAAVRSVDEAIREVEQWAAKYNE